MNIPQSNPFEPVFACEDTAVLILQLVDIQGLKSLRLVNKILRYAVNRWIIKRLIVDLDEIQGSELTRTVAWLSMRFPSVDALVIRHANTSAEIQALIHSWSFHFNPDRTHLKTLEIDSSHVDGWDVDMMQDCLFLSEVERLEISGCPCTSVDAVSALMHTLTPCLHTLLVDDVEFQDSRIRLPVFSDSNGRDIKTIIFVNNIQENEAHQCPLFCSPSSLSLYQERLENLDLSGNSLGLDNIRLLFHEWEFKKLKKLRLRRCNLYESHAEIMSLSTSLVALCHLDLAENQLSTQASMYYISSSLQFKKQLQYLNLSNQAGCQQDSLYVWFLSMYPWESLVTLKMNHASLNAAGMHGLLQTKMVRIRHVSFREAYLTSDALAMLGRSTLFSTQLETLDLRGTKHGVEVRRAFPALAYTRGESLKKLYLRGSGLTSARAKSADRKALKALRTFHGASVEIQICS